MPSPLLVSIVIPCYNASRWISTTLQSCINQTYPHIEIILVDDGSTDDSVELAKEYLSSHNGSFQIFHTPNGGPSRARNLGWQNAHGDWIQFLDADDFIHPSKLSLQLNLAIGLESSYSMIFSCWQRVSSDSTLEKPIPVSQIVTPQIYNPVLDVIGDGNFIATGSQIYSRMWLDRVGGFDESMNVVEDVNLLIKLATREGLFKYCPSEIPLFYYRQSPNSTSQRNPVEFSRNCFKNAETVLYWLEINNQLDNLAKQRLIAAYSFVARSIYRHDILTFERVLERLNYLSPDGKYIPFGPRHLRIVTKLFGYRNAELVASIYHQLRSFIPSSNR